MKLTLLVATLGLGVALGAQDYPHDFPREGVRKLFENERLIAWEVVWKKDVGAEKPAIDNARVLEWDYTWQPGRPVPLHVHERDAVQVFSEGGTIKFTRQDGKADTVTFAPKDTRFIARGTIDAEEAVAGRPRAVTIELK